MIFYTMTRVILASTMTSTMDKALFDIKTAEAKTSVVTKTTVVNVKVRYIRKTPIKYNNLKQWDADSNNVYIGRRGIVFVATKDGKKERFPKKDSVFANPFKTGSSEQVLKYKTSGKGRAYYSLKDSLSRYEKYIRDRLDNDKSLVTDLKALDGKNLGCWCVNAPSVLGSDEVCHGHVLLRLINEYK